MANLLKILKKTCRLTRVGIYKKSIESRLRLKMGSSVFVSIKIVLNLPSQSRASNLPREQRE